MPRNFYRQPGLNVDVYTPRTAALEVVDGDVEFYTELALASGPGALELGCGAEYSGYDKAPPAYGCEQIWIARRD